MKALLRVFFSDYRVLIPYKVGLSGSISKSGSPVSRKIEIYTTVGNGKIGDTQSDPTTGDFSIKVGAGPNDLFRVIAVGIAGENSRIADRV